MAELDLARLRELSLELGYWPATTDDEHLEKLRADNERFDRMNAHGDHHHHPCPVCGEPTRYKQFPIHCLCNRYDPKPFTFPWENDPAWQERIRQAKQEVADG